MDVIQSFTESAAVFVQTLLCYTARMVTELTVIIRPQDEHNMTLIKHKASDELVRKGIRCKLGELTLVQIKKSIDARHGQVKLCMRYKAYIGENPEAAEQEAVPQWKAAAPDAPRVIIVGAGPAGLFGALRLLESGIRPVIIERGKETPRRKQDIAAISTKGIVDADSNYCFGEGGAGTFSDGKLYTRSNKRGDIGRILRIFHYFGADKSILTDAHPHIGTDRLPAIVNAMRAKITELGGEFRFNTRCTGFVMQNGFLTGVTVRSAADGADAAEQTISGSAVVLATGHSATDIYELIARTAPGALEAKTFAAGVRAEHPRELIDAIQYHGKKDAARLPAAEYRLTAQIDGRGVYSFCMCPGGFIVPSATGPEQIVVNGMSSAARNSRWSNAAIVVEIRPEDIPQTYRDQAAALGCPALAGLLFRTELERQTFRHGNGQAAPAQRLTDFLTHRSSEDLPDTSYTPGVTPSRLDEWLPPFIADRLAAGIQEFNKNMKGFVAPDALLVASETRTSTPVRILRDKETLQSPALPNLYPAGEGSGYSGGIVSSAMDGEHVCKAVAEAVAAAR